MAETLACILELEIEKPVVHLLNDLSNKIKTDVNSYEVYTETRKLDRNGLINQIGWVAKGKAEFRVFVSYPTKRIVIIDIVTIAGETYVKHLKSNVNIEKPGEPIELSPFLYRLLTNAAYYEIIKWTHVNGSFRMTAPHTIAKLWGWQKGRTNMTYDKMSRALRARKGDRMRTQIVKIDGHFCYRFIKPISVKAIASRIEREINNTRKGKLVRNEDGITVKTMPNGHSNIRRHSI